jgi:hypothetical protein
VSDELLAQIAAALAVVPAEAELLRSGRRPADTAIDTAARAAHEAVRELRRLLPAVPRAEDAPLSPVPGLAEIRLTALHRRHDRRVRIEIERGLGGLPAGVQLALHHAVAAVLALHDAGAGTSSIQLHRAGGDVELLALLGGKVSAPTRETIASVERRAVLYGGTATWTPGRLLLRLPIEPPSG